MIVESRPCQDDERHAEDWSCAPMARLRSQINLH
jgi:hypothetical protein